jgi:hypothetical protein
VLSDIDHPVFERCLAGLVTIDQHTLKLTSPVNLRQALLGPAKIKPNGSHASGYPNILRDSRVNMGVFRIVLPVYKVESGKLCMVGHSLIFA